MEFDKDGDELLSQIDFEDREDFELTSSQERRRFSEPVTEIPADALDFWMCRLICEIKRQDGTVYPALSVKNICIGYWIVFTQSRACHAFSLEEEMLWAKGTFSSETSSGLLHAVYFYNCKVFGVRAADEHANLEVSQFEFGRYSVGEYVRFIGRVTKNNQGGLKQCGKIQFK
ncbi:uncharacterized protein [Haliotis asinina]|uniref:uncharacterized protein n=1 Tax=Haliotis asinina TaxID=109174 RepID=UPI003531A6A1